MAELHLAEEQSIAPELAAVERALLTRWPESKIEPSLDRIAALVDLLGAPQTSYPVIHVTGTNGKTSTARMIEALLRAFGLRTGLFTSPHLESMRERIAFDGVPIEPQRFVDTYAELEPYLGLVDRDSAVNPGRHPLSFFESLVAMAYAAFAEAPVDVAIVEVGMGGTWDATNVADGQVAVITPVSLDHANYLGGEVAGIAAEKAGIVKVDAFAVLAQQSADVTEVLLRRCADVGATVALAGREFGLRGRLGALGGQVIAVQGLGGRYEELFLPLLGEHQAHNAACALAAVEAFLGGGQGPLDADIVRAGFAGAHSPGRLEVVRRAPTILLDAAHNPAAAAATASALATDLSFGRLVGVIGVMADKDAHGILAALEPVLAEVVVTAVPGRQGPDRQGRDRRGMDPDTLAALAVEVFGADRVEVAPRLDDAVEAAVALAEVGGDLAGAGVLVTGSVVLAGAARAVLGRGDAQ